MDDDCAFSNLNLMNRTYTGSPLGVSRIKHLSTMDDDCAFSNLHPMNRMYTGSPLGVRCIENLSAMVLRRN
jgi:hypothetical protein